MVYRILFCIFLAIFLMMGYLSIKHKKNTPSNIIVQFAYPIISINPTDYDDWESGFIANHIYYRLLPEEGSPFKPYLTKSISITCDDPKSSILTSQCKRMKILFRPKQFADCIGTIYTKKDILYELQKILIRKNWIIPSWKICDSSKDAICITGKYVPDQLRRMKNINLRFGWSKSDRKNKIFGSAPYCLYPNFNSNSQIVSGSLKPILKKDILPVIEFHTSQNKADLFHVALYGSKSLLTNSRKNIQVHTPLAYYVITHPRLSKYSLPWNTPDSKGIIHDYLTENEIFFSEVPQFIKFSPQGKALFSKNKMLPLFRSKFAIPNYLPECSKLANMLNRAWIKSQTTAYCVDIIDYVYKNVISSKKDWDGFLVGISASDPSRDAFRYQYFSPDSAGSWTYSYQKPDYYFYLAGIGQSFVTVDKHKICGIHPNSLGLGNIFITDLIPCDR